MKKRVLVTAKTKYELFLASSVILLLDDRASTTYELLVSPSVINSIPERIKNLFVVKHIRDLPELGLSRRDFFRNIKLSLDFSKFLKTLDWNYTGAFINSYNAYFANMIYRRLKPDTKLYILTPYKSVKNSSIPLIPNKMLHWQLNLFHRIFGYSETRYKWSKESRRMIQRKLVRLPSHKRIFINDKLDIASDLLTKDDYFCQSPFLALRGLYPEAKNSKPAILVNGERTPSYPSWSEADERQFRKFFDYLRENFSDHELCYKPRPGHTKMEMMQDKLTDFKILSTSEPFESLIARSNFKKVISLKSTASVQGASFNIPSYLIYPLFDYPADFKIIVDNFFKDADEVVRVSELKDLHQQPKPAFVLGDIAKQYRKIIK